MNKKDLIDITNPMTKEAKFKSILIDILNKDGIEYALRTLLFKNRLILAKLDISEGEFNYILFKNYVLFSNNDKNVLNKNNLSKRDIESINLFDSYLNSNNVNEAFNAFNNNSILFMLLGNAYVKSLSEDNASLVNGIKDEKVNAVYNTIKVLNKSKLSVDYSNQKVYQRVSSR